MRHFGDADFYRQIEAIPRFNHTTASPLEVSLHLFYALPKLEITIKPYKSKLPWSKAIGYAEGSTVWVNTRKLYLPIYDRVENIMHEATHLCGYSHDGNRVTAYNLGTVPYRVASIFKQHIFKLYS
jgi:hypothetical protein